MRLAVIGGIAAVVACAQPAPPVMKLTNAQLHDSLITRLAKDQAIRDSFVASLKATGNVTADQVMHMRAVDSANTAWLKPLVETNGLPTKAMVGADGVEAVFLLIQHADNTPGFQDAMLPLLEQAYKAGEVSGQDVALLSDRVAKSKGHAQSYGTQTTVVNGVPIIDAIGDSAHVDERRKRMGLMPLAEYKRKLDSMVAHPTVP